MNPKTQKTQRQKPSAKQDTNTEPMNTDQSMNFQPARSNNPNDQPQQNAISTQEIKQIHHTLKEQQEMITKLENRIHQLETQLSSQEAVPTQWPAIQDLHPKKIHPSTKN